jgi:hypothetical protein
MVFTNARTVGGRRFIHLLSEFYRHESVAFSKFKLFVGGFHSFVVAQVREGFLVPRWRFLRLTRSGFLMLFVIRSNVFAGRVKEANLFMARRVKAY